MIIFQTIWIESEPEWAKNKSDLELVNLYQESQDNLIIAILIERYETLIEIAFNRFYTDEDSVKELAHKFFENLCDKLLVAEIKKSFSGWLALYVRSRIFDELKRGKIKPEKEQEFYSRYFSKNEIGIEAKMDYEFINEEIKKLLTKREYKILFSKYFLEKSFQEISEELVLKEKKIQNICYRAIEKIRNDGSGRIPDDFIQNISKTS